MDEKKVVSALRNWSPQGLCSGVLVKKTDDETPMQACAVGCLALEFLNSKEGGAYLATQDLQSSDFINTHLWGGEDLETIDITIADEQDLDAPRVSFPKEVDVFFGFEPDDVDFIMNFNDNLDAVSAQALPPAVRDTILELRKKYEALHATKE